MLTQKSENFEFLSLHDAALSTLGGLAERYFDDDPPTCIFKLRQFSELLAKQVAARQGIYEQHLTFEELLKTLFLGRYIPKKIAALFHWLRKTGNLAAH